VDGSLITLQELREHISQSEKRLREELDDRMEAFERRLKQEMVGRGPIQLQDDDLYDEEPTEAEVQSLVQACTDYSGCQNLSQGQVRAVLNSLLPSSSEQQVEVLVNTFTKNTSDPDQGVDWQQLVTWLVDGNQDPGDGIPTEPEVTTFNASLEQMKTAASSSTKPETTIQKPNIPDTPEARPRTSQYSYEMAFESVGGTKALSKAVELSKRMRHFVADTILDTEIRDLLPKDFKKRKAYSTAVVSQHFVEDLDTLLAQADAVLESFHAKVQHIAEATQGTGHFPPRKSKNRAQSKAVFKYKEPNGGIAYHRLTDLVRATVSYKDIQSMYEALHPLEQAFGDSIKEFNDRYHHPMPGGYRDLQLVVEHNGHICELLLNTDSILRAKEATGHRRFEAVRELKAAITENDRARCVEVLEWGRESMGSKESGVLFEGRDGSVLLHAAASSGHADIVSLFLKHKANANGKDKKGNTPLHLAMQNGHDRVVWALLDQGGADHRQVNKERQVPLLEGYLMLQQMPAEHAVRAVCTLAHWSGAEHVQQVKKQVDDELKKKWVNSRYVVSLAADGRLKELKTELQNYSDPNSRDANGFPALVAATAEGHIEAVEMLLAFRANPGLKDRSGQSALDIAFQRKNRDAMALLLSAGAIPSGMIADFVETGKTGFASACVTRDGRVYCAPWDNSNLLIYDPARESIKFVDTNGVKGKWNALASKALDKVSGSLAGAASKFLASASKSRWSGIAVGEDGRLYCAPHNHSAILIFDPATEKVNLLETGMQGDTKWDGIAAGSDGRLYCAPLDSPSILCYDPARNKIKYIDVGPQGERKWNGIATGLDGRMYCAPYNHSAVLIYDPKTQAAKFVETGVTGERKWMGITLGADGRLYCAPCNNSSVLIIDPKNDKLKMVDTGAKGKLKWAGITSSPNGLLYCAPLRHTAVLVFDPRKNAVVDMAETGVSGGYMGIAAAQDGRLYCAPFRNSAILRFGDMGAALRGLGV